MAEPLLHISALSVEYRVRGGTVHATEGVDLAVHRGETVALVGESGSGKSVTAFSVMGLLNSANLQITAGSIRLQGEELVGASRGRLRELRGLRMSMVFQEPMTALNPVIRVGEQIAEVIRWHSRTPRSSAAKTLRSAVLPVTRRRAAAWRIGVSRALVLRPTSGRRNRNSA